MSRKGNQKHFPFSYPASSPQEFQENGTRFKRILFHRGVATRFTTTVKVLNRCNNQYISTKGFSKFSGATL
ncbi:hypothetical protein BRADI_3g11063v3 [Brachypodium distachyon]|uniref:Uncharacterized protein n=1 Tax=Brachypodium distachyon TaxID=15368 RepID=A0A2K2CWK7_BRADI|nr:hypothetical protein BRADI_3g11063v3 [Brachypodium distachyon]